MTADELCVCGHSGRDHHSICQVAACHFNCGKGIRKEPQPEAVAVPAPAAAVIPDGMMPGFFV